MEESVKVLKNALSCLPEGNGDIVLGVLKEKPALIYQFVQDLEKKMVFPENSRSPFGLILADKTFKINALSGEEVISNIYNHYLLSESFKKSFKNNKKIATPPVEVFLRELRSDVEIKQVASRLLRGEVNRLSELALTQHQIIGFIGSYGKKFAREESGSFMFLTEDDGDFFVVIADCCCDSRNIYFDAVRLTENISFSRGVFVSPFLA